MLLNLGKTDTVLPISSVVKSWWAEVGATEVPGIALHVEQLYERLVMGIDFSRDARGLAIVIGVTLLVVSFGVIGKLAREDPDSPVLPTRSMRRKTFAFLVAAACGATVTLGYYIFLAPGVWRWYLGVPFVVLLLPAVAGVFFLIDRKAPQRMGKSLLVVSFVLVSGVSVMGTGAQVEEARGGKTWGKAVVALQPTLDALGERDAIFASWAAGELGYLSDRPWINLEGLVGDKALLEANQSGKLLQWMDEIGVDYVVQWFPRDARGTGECPQLVKNETVNLRLKVLVDHCDRFQLIERLENATPGTADIWIWAVD
jgi:hypothetical protein